MKRLSKNQIDLLLAMQNGARLHFMPYRGRFNPNPYFFRSDTMKHCTKAAEGLATRGLIEDITEHHYERSKYVLTELGKSWKP